MQSKIESLTDLLAEFKSNNCEISILALQETWFIPHPELVNIPGYSFIHTHRKVNRGGGVGFLVKNSLTFQKIEKLSKFIPKSFECLTLEVTVNGKKLLVSSIYRSPSSPPHLSISEHQNLFLQNLDTHLNSLSSMGYDSYVLLDANINLLLPANNFSENYMDSVHTNGYVQCIQKATRIQNQSRSLIDHILSNTQNSTILSGTFITDVSDHFMTFVQLPVKDKHCKPKIVETRNFSHANIAKFKQSLASQKWEDTLHSNDVSLGYANFWSTFSDLYEIHFPIRKAKFNKNFHKISKHITNCLLKSRLTKIKLHKISIAHPSQDNVNKYKTYRNIFNRIARASKKLYFTNSLGKAKNDPKKTWDILREAMNAKTSTSKITKIKQNNITVTDPLEIANAFNAFFSNIGTEISESVCPTKHVPADFIPEIQTPDMEFTKVTQGVIVNIVKLLQSKSSMDINGISMKLLKEIAPEIGWPLAHIFNLSLEQGVFPEALKQSKIVPIHKGGTKDNCDNYRPIALLNSISKILEKIVAIRLSNHLDFNKLINESQFGFQRAKSTEQNLLLVIDYISKALNDGDFCIGIFLDLKKAFDVCSHPILLSKLEKMGVKGLTLKWFESYLKNRSQKVYIDGKLSSPCDINISVLQGSILGPILFLVMINDLPSCSNLKTAMFADDTQGLAKGKNLPTLINQVNGELKKWASWFRANKLKVNTEKTKYIIFHTKNKKVNLENGGIIYDDNEEGLPLNPLLITPLDRIHNNHLDKKSRSFKLLGILLDENLSFNPQIDNLKSKLAKSIYCINKVKHFLPLPALNTLYHSLIHSHLNYCTSIYSCTSQTNIEKIFKMQKKAIRIITHSTYTANTEPLFTSLNILPLHKQITLSNLTLMHSTHNDYAPNSLLKLWPRNTNRNLTMNLRNSLDYSLPKVNYSFFKKFPAYSFPFALEYL